MKREHPDRRHRVDGLREQIGERIDAAIDAQLEAYRAGALTDQQLTLVLDALLGGDAWRRHDAHEGGGGQYESDTTRALLDTWPTPVARAWSTLVRREGPLGTFDAIALCYTSVLRTVTLVLVADFLRSPCSDAKIARVLPALWTPHLNGWFTVMHTLGVRLAGPGDHAWQASYPELVDAARTFSRQRIEGPDGPTLHERMLRWRNDLLGHPALEREDELRAILPDARRTLEATVAHFAPLGDLTWSWSDGEITSTLQGSGPIASGPDARPALPRGTVLADGRASARSALSLSPFILAGEADEDPTFTDVFAFDGHTGSTVLYTGHRRRTGVPHALDELRRLVEPKLVAPNATRRHVNAWRMSEWARSWTLQALHGLRDSRYRPAEYIVRGSVEGDADDPSPEQVVLDFVRDDSAAPALLVSAPVGSGKTSLLCRSAEALLHRRPADASESSRETTTDAPDADVVVLLQGAGLGRARTLLAGIREALGMVAPASALPDRRDPGIRRFDELLALWGDTARAGGRLVIMLDALNEADDPKELWRQTLELITMASEHNQQTGRRDCAFVLTAREEWLAARNRSARQPGRDQQAFSSRLFADVRSGDATRPWLTLRPFTEQEIEQGYLKAAAARREQGLPWCRAPWRMLPHATRQVLARPMNLGRFHDAYADVEVAPVRTTSLALWSAYLTSVLGTPAEARPLRAVVERIADAVLQRAERERDDRPRMADLAELSGAWHEACLTQGYLTSPGLLDVLESAGVVRVAAGGVIDWAHDAIGTQLLYEAIDRAELTDPPERGLTGTTARLRDAWIRRAAIGLVERRFDVALALARSRRTSSAVALSSAFGVVFELVVLESEQQGRFDEVHRLLDEFTSRAIAWGTRRALQNLAHALVWAVLSFGVPLRDPARERARLLEASIPLHERLCRVGVVTDAAWLELANVYGLHGRYASAFDPESARESLHRAIQLAERVSRSRPRWPAPRRALARFCESMGTVVEPTDPVAGAGWLERSVSILTDLNRVPSGLRDARALGDATRRYALSIRNTRPRQAREAVARSIEIARDVLRNDPGPLANHKTLAHALESGAETVADVDREAALRWATEAVAILRERQKTHRMAVATRLAGALSTLGSLPGSTDPVAALEVLRESIAIREELVEAEPDNRRALRNLVVSYKGAADQLRFLQRDESLAMYERALHIAELLLQRHPHHRVYRRDVMVIASMLADGLFVRGELSRAAELHESAAAMTERLLAEHPDDLRAMRDHAIALGRRGESLIGRRDDEAEDLLARAHHMIRLIVSAEPDNLQFRRDFVTSVSRYAKLAERCDDPRAVDWYIDAHNATAELIAASGPDHVLTRDLGLAAGAAARLLAATGSEDDARAWWDSAESAHLIGLDTTSARRMGLIDLGGVLFERAVFERDRRPHRARWYAARSFVARHEALAFDASSARRVSCARSALSSAVMAIDVERPDDALEWCALGRDVLLPLLSRDDASPSVFDVLAQLSRAAARAIVVYRPDDPQRLSRAAAWVVFGLRVLALAQHRGIDQPFVRAHGTWLDWVARTLLVRAEGHGTMLDAMLALYEGPT